MGGTIFLILLFVALPFCVLACVACMKKASSLKSPRYIRVVTEPDVKGCASDTELAIVKSYLPTVEYPYPLQSSGSSTSNEQKHTTATQDAQE